MIFKATVNPKYSGVVLKFNELFYKYLIIKPKIQPI